MTGSVKLGLMPPLSGLVSLYGFEIVCAGRVACAEINQAGGVLGRPLELVIEDDGSLPETAVPAAERLIHQHGCAAIIGNLLSNARIDVACKVAEPNRIPYLNFSFYEGSISSPFFFHFAALPNQQIDRMIPAMARRFGKKMFFAGSNYEWPRGSIDAARRALAGVGGEVVGECYFPLGEVAIPRLLDAVAKSGADVFAPYFAGAEQLALLDQFADRGLKERLAVVMGHYDEVMASTLRPEVREGLYACNTYFMSVATPENRAFLAHLAQLPEVDGIWPHGNGILTSFGEGVYLCVKAFAQAANAAGALAPAALVPALERVRLNGPQGQVAMVPALHHAEVNAYLGRCQREGTFAIVEQCGPIAPEIPPRYHREAEPARGGPARQVEQPAPPGEGFDHVTALVRNPRCTGLALLDAEGRISYANPLFKRYFNGDAAMDAEPHWAAALWPSRAGFHSAAAQVRRGHSWQGELATVSPAGACGSQAILAPLSIKDGELFGMALYVHQPAARQARHDEMDAAILALVEPGVIAIDARERIIRANPSALRMFGYAEVGMTGMPAHLLFPPRFRPGLRDYLRSFFRSPLQEGPPLGHQGEINGYRRDGSAFSITMAISKFLHHGQWILVATLRDNTDCKQAEEALTWHATHDPLTRLANKNLITDRLRNALQRSARYGGEVALLCIDLDGFKLVNDGFGFDEGDRVLQIVAERLVGSVRPGDAVARLEGDEFAILCEKVEDHNAMGCLADRINQVLRQPLNVAGHQFTVTASIGLALGRGGVHEASELLRNADAALYAAKAYGRDNWRFFQEDIHLNAKRYFFIVSGLHQAIAREEFQLRYQPIVDCATGRLCGVEALLRWFPSRGEVPPGEFIPIAEANGAIGAIGEWVFRQACRAQARWRTLALPGGCPYLSVNLSTRQLNEPDLAQRFQRILRDEGADPAGLMLEITETSLMENVDANMQVLRQLAALGVRLAVDDFGAGYSSLIYLKRLHAHALKIDRSFIRDLAEDKDDKTIVSAILSMASSLHLTVVAEGVENDDQLAFLKERACDLFQGYLFSPPIREEELLARLMDPSPQQAGASMVVGGLPPLHAASPGYNLCT